MYIQRISVSYAHTVVYVIHTYIHTYTHGQYLDVSGHRISQDGMSALCAELEKNTCLRDLKVGHVWDVESQAAVASLLRRNTALTSLSISSRCCPQHIFDALKHNSTLESIRVESHTHREEALMSLSCVLRENFHLQKLVTQFQGASSPSALLAIGKALQECPRYHELIIRGIDLSRVSATLGLPTHDSQGQAWTDTSVAPYIHSLHLDKVTAFIMGLHSRLGSESLVRILSHDCARVVVLGYFGLPAEFVNP
jgi:hypothetical protein